MNQSSGGGVDASWGPSTQLGAWPISRALSNTQFCGQTHRSRVGASPQQGRAWGGQDTWRPQRTLWVVETEIRVMAMAMPLSEVCS